MAASRGSARSRVTLVFLVLLSVTVLTLDFRGDGSGLVDGLREVAGDALAPVRSVVQAALRPLGDTWNGVTRYDDLERENADLRARLAEVEGARLRAEDALRERRQLRDLQQLDFAADVPAVPARVVSAPVGNFEQTIEIDRGRTEGVAVDMPVVTGAGLVGRVVDVSDDRAAVRLITDLGSSIGVRLAGSGDLGLAEGRGRDEPLGLGFLDPDAPVRAREAVVTSGLNTSVFPPDIPVGRVGLVRGGGATERTVTVEPAVDMTRLEYVKVLQWTATVAPGASVG